MATPPFLSQIEGPVSFPGFFLPLSGIRIAHFSGFVNRKVYETVGYFTKDLLGRYNIPFARRAGRGLAPGGRACYNGDVQLASTKPYGKKGFSLKKLFALCLIVALLCAAAVAEEAPVRVGTLKGATTIGLMNKHGKGKMSSRASVMDEVFKDVDNPITAAYVEAAKTNRGLPCMNTAFSQADEAITRSVTRLSQGEDPAAVLEDVTEEIKELYSE